MGVSATLGPQRFDLFDATDGDFRDALSLPHRKQKRAHRCAPSGRTVEVHSFRRNSVQNEKEFVRYQRRSGGIRAEAVLPSGCTVMGMA